MPILASARLRKPLIGAMIVVAVILTVPHFRGYYEWGIQAGGGDSTSEHPVHPDAWPADKRSMVLRGQTGVEQSGYGGNAHSCARPNAKRELASTCDQRSRTVAIDGIDVRTCIT